MKYQGIKVYQRNYSSMEGSAAGGLRSGREGKQRFPTIPIPVKMQKAMIL